MWRECPESSRDNVLVLGWGHGVVDFEDTDPLDPTDSVGPAVETNACCHGPLVTGTRVKSRKDEQLHFMSPLGCWILDVPPGMART